MMSTLKNDKYLSVSDILKRLEADNFKIDQKDFEKIVKKNNIDCFPIHGEWRVDFQDWEAKSEQIQKDLANHYKNSNANISAGQLRAKAIARGVMKWLSEASDKQITDDLLQAVNNQFTNRTEFGNPIADKTQLRDYARGLVTADLNRKTKNKKASTPSPTNVGVIANTYQDSEVQELRDELTENMETLKSDIKAEILKGQNDFMAQLMTRLPPAPSSPKEK